MSKKFLNHLELPNVVDDLNPNPQAGFSRLYADQDGKIVRKLPDGSTQNLSFENFFSSEDESDRIFTYELGNLTRIDYESGNYKLFNYNGNGDLIRLDYIRTEGTFRKDFTYDLEGNLISVVYSQVV